MSSLLRAPFEQKEGWILCAAKWQGTIYLTVYDTEEKKIQKANRTPLHIRSLYWGHKFEQYVLSGIVKNK